MDLAWRDACTAVDVSPIMFDKNMPVYRGVEVRRADPVNGSKLDPHKIYRVLRPAAELAKAARSFADAPILTRHVHIATDSIKPTDVVGTVGSRVYFSDPYMLAADACIWSQDAIDGIASGFTRARRPPLRAWWRPNPSRQQSARCRMI